MSHPLKLIRVISEGRPAMKIKVWGWPWHWLERTGAVVDIVPIPQRGTC